MTKPLKELLQDAGKASFTRQEVLAVAESNGIDVKVAYQTINNLHRVNC